MGHLQRGPLDFGAYGQKRTYLLEQGTTYAVASPRLSSSRPLLIQIYEEGQLLGLNARGVTLSEPIFDVNGLVKRYGNIMAVDNLSKGEIFALLGPNRPCLARGWDKHWPIKKESLE